MSQRDQFVENGSNGAAMAVSDDGHRIPCLANRHACDPIDGIAGFLSAKLDALAMGPFLATRPAEA